jgi:hypothetical protein
MTTWSTESVAANDGFAFWQDAVCRAVLSVSTESPPQDQFRAWISGRAYGAVRIAAFNSSGHDIVRRSSHVRALTEGGYLISLQQRGVGLIEQGETRFVLGPGEIAILDGERPFKSDSLSRSTAWCRLFRAPCWTFVPPGCGGHRRASYRAPP